MPAGLCDGPGNGNVCAEGPGSSRAPRPVSQAGRYLRECDKCRLHARAAKLPLNHQDRQEAAEADGEDERAARSATGFCGAWPFRTVLSS